MNYQDQYNKIERNPNFIKWVGSTPDDTGTGILAVVMPRYAIVKATIGGTGLQWMRFSPVSGSTTYSSGNFYGDTLEEVISKCERAIEAIIQNSQSHTRS